MHIAVGLRFARPAGWSIWLGPGVSTAALLGVVPVGLADVAMS